MTRLDVVQLCESAIGELARGGPGFSCTRSSCRYAVTAAPRCALLFAELGGMTLQQVADALGGRDGGSITRERVRQIEARALARPSVRALALEAFTRREA